MLYRNGKAAKRILIFMKECGMIIKHVPAARGENAVQEKRLTLQSRYLISFKGKTLYTVYHQSRNFRRYDSESFGR